MSNDSDNVVALSRFRGDVARALTRRGRALLETDDLAQTVPALDALEIYFIAKELGVETAAPLLAHASEEQLQTFVDLDCWESDERPSLEELNAWLVPFAHEGYEALARAFLGLDGALQVLFIAAHLTVFDARSEDIPDTDDGTARMATPDGFFIIDTPIDSERELDPFQLIEAIYRHNPEDVFRLLMASKWEILSTLEEEARSFRVARLEDLGFPTRAEALSIFGPPHDGEDMHVDIAGRPPPVALPALYAGPLASTSLVTEALGRVTDVERLAQIEHEIVYLINAAIVAFGASPRDLRHAQSIAERVRDTLSLGLEVLLARVDPSVAAPSDASLSLAADLLTRTPTREVFRHGHAATVPLGRSARALVQDPVIGSWLEQSESEGPIAGQLDRFFVHALTAHPLLHGGFDAAQPRRVKSFSSRAEVDGATARLDELAARLV